MEFPFLGLSKAVNTPPGVVLAAVAHQQPQSMQEVAAAVTTVQNCVAEDDPFGSAPFSMPNVLLGGGGGGAAATAATTTSGVIAGGATRKAGGND